MNIIDIASTALNFIKTVNSDYAQVILIGVAVATLIYVAREYGLKRRPFMVPELNIRKKDGDWYFDVVIVNKGSLPGLAKTATAKLIIGDEEYPTIFNQELLLTPDDRQTLASLGHINLIGRNKIIGHEYKINRVEIILLIESRSIGDKKYKYITKIEYYIDVKNDDPIITYELLVIS